MFAEKLHHRCLIRSLLCLCHSQVNFGFFSKTVQPAFTCIKLTIETLEEGVKSVQK